MYLCPCEKIEVIDNITLNCQKQKYEYIIEPNKGYIFTIDDSIENCSLTFNSELDNFFYKLNEQNALRPVDNGTNLSNGNKIYTNIFLNTTEDVKITILSTNKTENEEEEEEHLKNKTHLYFRARKTGNKMSTAGIILISILIPLAVVGIITTIIILTRKASNIPKNGATPYTENSLKKFNNFVS